MRSAFWPMSFPNLLGARVAVVTLGDALKSADSERSNNFLLLRLLAASAVVYGHSWSLGNCVSCGQDLIQQLLHWRYAGDVGLLVLFTISGFLVSDSFARRGIVSSYFVSRATRILPGLGVFCLVLAVVVGPLISTLGPGKYLSDPRVTDFIWTNATLQPPRYNLPGVFETNKYGPAAVGTLWTLWIEVRLYILVAVAGLLGALRNKLFGNCLVISLAAWTVLSPSTFPLVPINTANRDLLSYFAVGVLAYINRDVIPLRWDVLVLFAVIAFLSVGQASYEVVVRGGLAYATLWLAFLPRIALPRWAADYSYGIYLYGWPVQQIIAMVAPDMSPVILAAIALPLSWLCGAASWHLVEKHPIAWKRRALRSVRPPGPLSTETKDPRDL